MDVSKLRDDRVVEQWLLSETEVEARIEIPAHTGDWQKGNEIRAEIYLPPGVIGALTYQVELNSRAPGFDFDDAYYNGGGGGAQVSEAGGNIWEGWHIYRHPIECFYLRGMPAQDWGKARLLRIIGPKGSRIRRVWLVQREIAEGPRTGDEALLSALDMDRPEFERAKAADSTDAVLGEVVRYFRASVFDRQISDLPVPSEKDTPRPWAGDPAEAERIMAGQIMGQDWSQGIDWQANPTGYIEWSVSIHYFYYLKPLIAAWWRTREPRFILKAGEIIDDWVRCNPISIGVRSGGFAWGHSLAASVRPFTALADLFAALCACPETPDRTILNVLKTVYEHARYMLAFQSFRPSNKSIAEARALLAIGCAFPEFREALFWREEAGRRLLDDMRVQVFPDGASFELTPGYQGSIASWFLDAFQVAQKFNHPLHPELEAGIRRMYDWMVAITRPDFTRPSASDAGSLNGKYGAVLARPGRILNSPSALWVGTEGKEGQAPDYASVALRDSGYVVMRSGWDKNARYLFFDGGPYGMWHQHEDMLNFEVYAFGAPFIVDPGISTYMSNPWVSFYHTAQAHNVVMVDGCGQNRGRNQTKEAWVASARDRLLYRSDDRSDVAMATYGAGYAGLEAQVIHRRAVVFVKPDYWIVLDELTGDGTHAYEALFHFMPYRVSIDAETRAVRTGRNGASNIELLPLAPMGVRLICGQIDPVQGWLAIDGQDVPAPVAVYRKKARLPFRTGYVIAPYGADRVTAGFTAKVSRRADRWKILITRPDGRQDRLGMDWGTQEGPVLDRGETPVSNHR